MKEVIGYKIKALTLMEVIIAMIISSIVISLTFMCLRIFMRDFNRVQSKGLESYTIQSFHALLNSDLFYCKQVIDRENKLYLDNGDRVIVYHFTDSIIIREQAGIIDSFSFSFVNYELVPIDSGGENGRLINSLSFTILNSKDTFNFELFKDYEPNLLLSRLDNKNEEWN